MRNARYSQYRSSFKTIVVGLTLILGTAACGGSGNEGAQEAREGDVATPEPTEDNGGSTPGGVINIGILMPTSGPAATLGATQIDGMRLRVEEANEAGGILGNQVELTVYDDEANPATGLSAFSRAVNQDGQRLFMGPVITTVGTALIDAANEAQALLVSPTIRAESFVTECEWCYSLSPSAAQWAAAEASYYEELGASDIYVIGDQSETARNDVDEMKQYLAERPPAIVGEDYIDTTQTQDYSPFIQRVGSAESDLVHTIVASVPPQVQFLREAIDSGLAEDAILTMSPGLAEDTINALNEAEVDANGLRGIDFWISSIAGNSKNEALREGFEASTGDPLTKYAVLGYSTADVLLQAIEEAGSPAPEDVASALDELSYDAPFGEQRFVDGRFEWVPERFLRLVVENGELTIVDE